MNIYDIDRNFYLDYANENDFKFKEYKIPHKDIDLYGVKYDENASRFVRMPIEIADSVSTNVSILNYKTAGGRLRFRTNAKAMKLVVEFHDPLMTMFQMPYTGQAGFILNLDFPDGSERHMYTFSPRTIAKDEYGFSFCFLLPSEKLNDYTLYFPLYNEVKSVTLYFSEEATVTHGKKYIDVLPILYYGSSITQGGCASRSDNSYQSMISKWYNVDHINLGFSGSAKAEQIMCDYLATIPCSIFVCDYDHNAPTEEHLKNTHYNLYETFRKKQPDTPIIFATYPDYHKNIPVAKPRVKIIKESYKKALANGDKNVYFISGKDMYPKKHTEICSGDGTHPNDLGFYFMAKAFEKVIAPLLKKIQENK